MNKKGVLITLEGIDFSGKSTQAEMLAARLTQSSRSNLGGGGPVRRGSATHACSKPLLLREPGGTPLSEKVREVLLNRGEVDISDRTELLLFLAARAQLVDETILPALESGTIVVCDRFYDSTYAYQGFARGLQMDTVRLMNGFATSGLVPDLTLLYDLPVEVAQRRGEGLLPVHDRLEKERVDFHLKVREGYLWLAEDDPSRIKVIDANQDPDDIFRRTWEFAVHCLKEHGIDIEA